MGKVTGSKASNFPNGVRTDRDQLITTQFVSGSGAVTQYIGVPYKCEVVQVDLVQGGALPAVPGTLTLKIGSAGTTVATMALTSAGVAGAVQSQTTITAPAVAAGESISIAKVASGTAYACTVGVTVKRVD